MKNIELYGVQELNSKELKSVNGGFFLLAVIGAAVLGYIIGNAIGNSNDDCP